MKTTKATVIGLMNEWVAKGLATDKTGNNFQDKENNDILMIYVEPENAFSFLMELQGLVGVTKTVFSLECCTVFIDGITVGVIFNR